MSIMDIIKQFDDGGIPPIVPNASPVWVMITTLLFVIGTLLVVYNIAHKRIIEVTRGTYDAVILLGAGWFAAVVVGVLTGGWCSGALTFCAVAALGAPIVLVRELRLGRQQQA